MSYLLNPNEATSKEAVIWISVINENIDPSNLSLKCNGGQNVSLNRDWVRIDFSGLVAYDGFSQHETVSGQPLVERIDSLEMIRV